MISADDPRSAILRLLATAARTGAVQERLLGVMDAFVRRQPRCLERSTLEGHFTASACVVDAAGERMLLLHHRKLDRWLQPGGHADGDGDLVRVARREIEEETGLRDVELLLDGVFDLDVHTIPATVDSPEHLHYDVRFLFRAAPDSQPMANHESLGVRWVRLAEVASSAGDASVQRLAAKAQEVLGAQRGRSGC